ncbi:RraA family protein [Candidatus Gracilibacteria bacterium]|nr:RraA family protein [Candidatus Gracilibacteria bacterium]
MHIQPTRDDLIALTHSYDGARFADGRPQVSDDLLARMQLVTTEEAWAVLRKHGFYRQFAGNWQETHPGTITVGRAVTAQFLPHRPDYHQAVQQAGLAEGRGAIGGQNSWIIESLQHHDVMVVDIFGKVKDGTVVGDNLGTAVRSRTRAGAVIDGGIRDYQGLVQLTDVNFYVRGVDPSAIADVTLAGINIPIRIGEATVLPGDVVLGTPTGVIFIPAHLAQEVVEVSENVRVRDEFGKLRLAEGRYTSGEIDVPTWRDDIEADFQAWQQAQP